MDDHTRPLTLAARWGILRTGGMRMRLHLRIFAAILVGGATVLPASASGYLLPRLPTERAGAAGLQVRPAVIGFTGDGTGFLGGFTGASWVGRPSREVLQWAGRIHWSTWTSTEASGTGAIWSNNGEPDDARGTFYPRAATVRAYDPVNGVFRRLTYGSGGQTTTRQAVRYGGYWEWG